MNRARVRFIKTDELLDGIGRRKVVQEKEKRGEKLHDHKDLPKAEMITEKMSKRWGTNTMVIPAPIEVDALMQKVPKGKLVTINEPRESLAKKHQATIGCPITTGIFRWVAAHAAEERRREGSQDVTP